MAVMNGRIEALKDQLAEFYRRHRLVGMALFGSVLREDFGPESDVDVLVTFATDAHHSTFDLADMREELSGSSGATWTW